MIYKGIIVEINKKFMVVMTDDMGYRKIATKSNHKVGQAIYFTETDMITRSKLRMMPSFGMRQLAYAAIFMLVLLTASQVSSFMPIDNDNLISSTSAEILDAKANAKDLTVASIVTIDINPSVKLMLDSNDTVIRVKALNEDAATLSLNHLVGNSVEVAVEEIVNIAKDAGFINLDNLEEDYVLITTIPVKGKVLSSDDDDTALEDDEEAADTEVSEDDVLRMNKLQEKIEKKIEENPELQEVNVAIIKATIREMRAAEGKHIPVGLFVVGGEMTVENEDGDEVSISVREYFSDTKNIDKFKKKGQIVEKKNESKFRLAELFIAKLNGLGVDTTALQSKLQSSEVDIDLLLSEIKALWAVYDDEEELDDVDLTDEESDEEEDDTDKPDEGDKPGGNGKPEGPGKPNGNGKSDTTNKGNN